VSFHTPTNNLSLNGETFPKLILGIILLFISLLYNISNITFPFLKIPRGDVFIDTIVGLPVSIIMVLEIAVLIFPALSSAHK